MGKSKIIYAGQVLIDLTGDTVTADKLLTGTKAHGADGEPVVGACDYDANTQDATAAAAEILKGKTAYNKGAKVTGTILPTAQKRMEKDVTVHPIPYFCVSNPSGGDTVYIGGEIDMTQGV